MPDGGGDAEAALEAFQPLGGEGDFRQQDQGLAALAEAFGDGFQVDLGLAGAGDAIQQGDGELAGGDCLAQGCSGGCSGSGMAKGGSMGRIAEISRPASAMPRTTLEPTPAVRARSLVAQGSLLARASRTFWRDSVMRASGRGSARRQPVAGGVTPCAMTRRAIAITSPGGASV
jgi:hypothetical protein